MTINDERLREIANFDFYKLPYPHETGRDEVIELARELLALREEVDKLKRQIWCCRCRKFVQPNEIMEHVGHNAAPHRPATP